MSPEGRDVSEAEQERAREEVSERVSHDKVLRLHQLTVAFLKALTPEQVAGVGVEQAVEALPAAMGMVYGLSADGTRVEMLGSAGLEPADQAHFQSMPVSAASSATEALRTGAPIFVESLEQWQAHYPEVAALSQWREGARAAMPLQVGQRCIGVLAVGLESWRPFASAERAFLMAVANLCAHALERARLMESEQQARAEAQAAVHARDDFLCIAGHELRTPLTTARLQLALLKRLVGAPPAELAERLPGKVDVLERQMERLSQLVDQLLDMSRITSHRLELVRERMELTELVREVLERMDAAVQRSGSRLTFSSGGPAWGSWDRLRLEQIVTNLLSNACKYGSGQPIHVRVEPGEGTVLLTVRDQGPGISPQAQARIFERFERAVADRRISGLGLGLWITRQCVEAHGGEIQVESAPGQGALFTVRLPCE